MKIYMYGACRNEVPYIEEWQEEHPEVTVDSTTKLSNEGIVNLSKGSGGVVVFQQKPYSDEALRQLASNGIIKISLQNIGVDNLNHELVRELGFQITNVPVCSPVAVVEFSATQALNLLRRTKEFYLKLAKGDYNWAPRVAKEMNKQVVGIVEIGNVGSMTAKIFAGFGAKVIACSRRQNKELEGIVEYISLDELYKRATIISLCLPHVPTTDKMLNEKTFAIMQDGVLLVNATREPLVDEKALIEALNSSKVGGAALDIVTNETRIFSQQIDFQEVDYNEFKDLIGRPNVLIMPHIAFYTDQVIKNMVKVGLSTNLDLIKTGTSDKLVKF